MHCRQQQTKEQFQVWDPNDLIDLDHGVIFAHFYLPTGSKSSEVVLTLARLSSTQSMQCLSIFNTDKQSCTGNCTIKVTSSGGVYDRI